MNLILLQSSKTFLLPQGNITFVRNTQMVLEEMRLASFSLVVIEELDLLKMILKEFPQTAVAVTPLIGNITHAVEAIRCGAIDYFVGPITESYLEKLLSYTHPAGHCLRDLSQGKKVLSSQPVQVVAKSLAMKQLLFDIQKISKSHASVLICGESGTGKEVIASQIHHTSSRHLHPFIKVNCAAIPESLLESEFFGHEKGAFTGAMQKRLGRFERATHGTLLLDEVSEIPLLLQSKLLRAIQEQEFERVGGTESVRVNVRLIATSNRCLKTMVKQKKFREDLYFRLNVIPLQIPSLRQRQEDIVPLAHHFLHHYCNQTSAPLKQLSSKAHTLLRDYAWPGNVRELSNVMERAVVMHEDQLLEPFHLGLDPLFSQDLGGKTLAEMEQWHLTQILAECSYHLPTAAKALGISLRVLRVKMLKYQIPLSAVG
ncbi:MAG: sigma-54 dependent transcriptional regulator [Candidatus Rhabdochlamydia sp.]